MKVPFLSEILPVPSRVRRFCLIRLSTRIQPASQRAGS